MQTSIKKQNTRSTLAGFLKRLTVGVAAVALAGFMALTASAGPAKNGKAKVPDSGRLLPYRNPKLPVDVRVADLLSRMTQAEKLGQLQSQLLDRPELGARRAEVGNVRNAAAFAHKNRWLTPAECAEVINKDQKFTIEGSRLGIPVIEHDESLHGASFGPATCFPQAIALAAMWDIPLMDQVAGAIGKEEQAVGVRQVLSPVVNISRDPRWGRTQETYGEDPYLSSRMGASFVKGLESHKVISSPKHFVANVGDGGRDSYAIYYSERQLREVYLPPFQACIQEGGAHSIMAAYNSVNGIPCHSDEWLLTKLLRDEWGFKGFVISDYEAIAGVFGRFNVAPTPEDGPLMAIKAGLDADLPNGGGMLPGLAKSGKLDKKTLDQAVGRILRAKFEIGMFDQPYVDPAQAAKVVRSQEHRDLALQAARESVVLLKNKGNLLPLKKSGMKAIGLFGPTANTANLGGYSRGTQGDDTTPMQSIQKIVGNGTQVLLHQPGQDPVALAKKCDVAIIFTTVIEAEGSDRSSIDLPVIKDAKTKVAEGKDVGGLIVNKFERELQQGDQEALIKAVAATGVPTVVVLINGSPVTMQKWLDDVGAVLEPWYGGEQGGTAVAEVLFGEYNPAGRLPITFPKSIGQVPLYYNFAPSGRGYDYYDLDGEPLFPFGYGLSYTKFDYSNIKVEPNRIPVNGKVTVSVDVKNSGAVKGDEVVQLYMHDEQASVARPLKELRGFSRVTLEPGQTKTVTFTLAKPQLAMWNREMKFVVEPGVFKVMVGASAKDIRQEGGFWVD